MENQPGWETKIDDMVKSLDGDVDLSLIPYRTDLYSDRRSLGLSNPFIPKLASFFRAQSGLVRVSFVFLHILVDFAGGQNERVGARITSIQVLRIDSE